MVEAAITDIAEEFIARLHPQFLEMAGKLWGIKHELEELKNTISNLSSVLDHAEELYHQSSQIKCWLDRLKETFYDVQDVIDELSLEVKQRGLRGHNEMIKEVRTFFSSSNQLAFKLKMRNKVRVVRKRMGMIIDDKTFHLDMRPMRGGKKREEMPSFRSEVDIKGRNGAKDLIMRFLLDSNVKDPVSILPIVGITGVGKTALAQWLYDDEIVSKYFHLKMWVCVSKDFDVDKIMKYIINYATKEELTEVVQEWLQSALRAKIDGKRYLLVLDDVWSVNLDKWLSLTHLLSGGARGSKILITTCNLSVAKITGTAQPYLLTSLSESESLELLMQMAGREVQEIQDSDMLAIGQEIVRKCSGIPLVIRTVGSLLFFKKTKLEWLHFKDHELPQVSQTEGIEAIEGNTEFLMDDRKKALRVESDWKKRGEMHPFICEGDIMGRDYEKHDLMQFLLDSNREEPISILPIVGIGGLGKTALAQCVYNDKIVSKHFHLKMWVCAPHDFNILKIVKDILVCAKKKETTEVEMERLQSELRAIIDGKRYLLVLDDLQNVEYEEWLSLKCLLVGGARGSKIFVITRLPLVAKITGTTLPFFLKGLSQQDSFDLLMRAAGQKIEEIQDLDMLELGKEIAMKCSGVPLAIRAIGNLLFFKKSKLEWLDFKNHELPHLSQGVESIKSVLRLIYDNLPSHLKQCFTFCSLFPKDYEIKKQTLIDLWVAEGFIKQSYGSPHLEVIADQYFKDLLQGNFLQDLKKDPFTNKETCKMPALMHDIACSVAGFKCWVALDDKESICGGTRHMSHGLTSNLMDKLPISEASKLRTFLSVPTSREMEHRESISEADLCQLIQSFKSLRILDLHAAIVKKVPRSICKLKHLTFLDLSHNNALKRLPNSITRLQHLQTLNLQGCSALEELPRDIRKLVSLRNLDIDYCHIISYVPCGLRQLSSLHRLTRFILPKGKALAKNYCGLKELKGLNDLTGSLSIENLGHSKVALEESKEANLIDKHALKSLILKWAYLDVDDAVIDDTDEAVIGNIDEALLDKLRPHLNLQKLTIDRYEGERFPWWMMDSRELSSSNLVEVRLLRCGRCKHLPLLSRLPLLKSLEIWRLTKLENIDEPHHSSTSTASFPSLLRLEIRECENLRTIPLAPHLEDLILRKVDGELINRIIVFKKLKRLDISHMEFLKYLPENCLQSLTSLERLGISECPQLTSLSGMRHLPNLVHLYFSNCEELDLSNGESDNILDSQGLTSLQFVDIIGVTKLAYLPQWLLRVSNLERLSIKKCLNLKALPEKMDDLQSLQNLEIIRCPFLTSLPEGIQRLKFLSHLRIAGCPNLEERCIEPGGDDWDKIARIPHTTHKLEYYERHL